MIETDHVCFVCAEESHILLLSILCSLISFHLVLNALRVPPLEMNPFSRPSSIGHSSLGVVLWSDFCC